MKRAVVFLYGSKRAIKVGSTIGLIGLWVSLMIPVSPAAYGQLSARSAGPVQNSPARDKNRAAAEQALAEADRLRALATADSFKAAIKKYAELIPIFHALGDRKTEADSLNNLGESYYFLGQYRQALDPFNQALIIFREIKDASGEAGVLTNIGSANSNLGNRQKALQCYEAALSVFRALRATAETALLLNNLGVLYTAVSDYPKAADSLNEALPLFRELKDKVNEGLVLNNLAAIYLRMDEKQIALDMFKQWLITARATGDRRAEGLALHNIGSTYGELGDSRKQMDYYLKALPVVRATGDRVNEAHVLNMMGVAACGLGDLQKSRQYLEEALALRVALGNRPGEADTLHNLAAVVGRLGDQKKAQSYYEKTLSILEATGDHRGTAGTLDSLGTIYRHAGDWPKAYAYYTRALQIKKSTGARSGISESLCYLAGLEQDRGNLNQAYAYIKEAIEIIETTRRAIKTNELRTAYSSIVQGAYEANIDILMQLHQASPGAGFGLKALQACEAGRARSLLELLRENRADLMQGLDQRLSGRERALRRQLNAKGEQQLEMLSGKPAPEQKAALEKEVRDLSTQYEETLAEIRAANPRYGEITQPQPFSPADIQREVLDDDTLLLEFSLGEARSYLWAVSKDSVASYQLPSRKQIEEAAERFINLITAYGDSNREGPGARLARHARLDREIPAAAAELSRLLLAPVAARLGSKPLLIVPDGILHYVPFAALAVIKPPVPAARVKPPIPAATYRPLLTEHKIINLPSASVLAVGRRAFRGRALPPKTVAIFADPVFDKNDPRVTGADKVSATGKAPDQVAIKAPADNQTEAEESDERDQAQTGTAWRSVPGEKGSLARLYFSREEAEAIYREAKAGTALKRLNFDANISAATDPGLGQYKIVHFSTHGILNSDQPELSGIVLSLVDERGQRREGFLGLSEIFNLKLPIELVTLSACQTALGKAVRGEGLVGLTRGFMYAGAKRVVASLWNVQDAATAQLMAGFYAALLSGRRADVALQQAQLKLLESKKNYSPYYWAGFVLQGEWR